MAKLSDDALDQIFRKARSYNGYTDQPVSDAELHAIWDIMKFGPTSANLLPARIIWVKSDEAKEKLAGLVSSGNAAKVRSAPITAIIAMDLEFYEQGHKLFPHDDVRPWFAGNEKSIADTAFRNSALQGAYLIIAARAIGLDTGPMSGFDNDAVDAAFFAGTSYKSNFICTIGHGDASTIFDRLPRPDFAEFNKIA
ncbi:malonic semialdehyde reductase [Sphingomonas montanisoli]|uniref:Putative NADH dehydrogenase/NAD(P)H nitroreductase FYJ91_10810 n=1 Tax=Sphingomonas montanisoli TaxID=2606412 RepID=A0A5D9CD30_9SPHN|nr:malonic semialdehyde reductase [Sphingomonas montanisoli]TZG28015.1 malonic semialdehyde reductase [Sphingomonas montanisoli]